MNKIWILSPWIWYHSHTGEKLIGKLMQSPSTTAIHGVELLQFSKRQIFLSTGVQLEGELAWRWWGALVASVFSRRPNSRSFFHWLRLTFSRAECRLWTFCPMKARFKGQRGTWSSSPPSCWWSRPWGIQRSRESIPTSLFQRIASLRSRSLAI